MFTDHKHVVSLITSFVNFCYYYYSLVNVNFTLMKSYLFMSVTMATNKVWVDCCLFPKWLSHKAGWWKMIFPLTKLTHSGQNDQSSSSDHYVNKSSLKCKLQISLLMSGNLTLSVHKWLALLRCEIYTLDKVLTPNWFHIAMVMTG